MNPNSASFKTSLTSVFGLFLCTSIVPAAITWSGDLNGGAGIEIPTNLDGIYLDFDDPNDAESYNSFADDGAAATTDWDVNFFFNGIGVAYSPTFQPARATAGDNLSRILNVAPDVTTVDETLIDYLGVPGSDFGGSGQSNDSSVGETHFGVAGDYFESTQVGYIAFILNPDSVDDKRYGWMEVTLVNGDTVPGTIHQWAFSDSPIIVGAIPEPGSIALLLVGAGLMLHRRRV